MIDVHEVKAVTIPRGSEAWANRMREAPETDAILNNLERDACIPAEAATFFFEGIRASRPAEGALDAHAIACALIQANPDRLICQGKPVPSDLFQTVARIVKQRNLKYHLTDEQADELASRWGVSRNQPLAARLSPAEIESISAWLQKEPIKMGNKLGVTWVADFAEIGADLGRPRTLVSLLGLDEDLDSIYVAFVYDRNKNSAGLRVPRALDAIDSAMFAPNNDCGADFGRTQSKSGEVGYAEAVHRAVVVDLSELEILRIS
ncbi:MAG: hypothetical protein AMXMBFR47_02610 [Planctomycetota bacterium]